MGKIPLFTSRILFFLLRSDATLSCLSHSTESSTRILFFYTAQHIILVLISRDTISSQCCDVVHELFPLCGYTSLFPSFPALFSLFHLYHFVVDLLPPPGDQWFMGTSASHNKEVSNEVRGRWPLCMYSVGSLCLRTRACVSAKFSAHVCSVRVRGGCAHVSWIVRKRWWAPKC